MDSSAVWGIVTGLGSSAIVAGVGQYDKTKMGQELFEIKKYVAACINQSIAVEKRVQQLESLKGSSGAQKTGAPNAEISRLSQRISLLEVRLKALEDENDYLSSLVVEPEAPPARPPKRPVAARRPAPAPSRASPSSRSQPAPARRPAQTPTRSQRSSNRRDLIPEPEPYEEASNNEEEFIDDDTAFSSVRM